MKKYSITAMEVGKPLAHPLKAAANPLPSAVHSHLCSAIALIEQEPLKISGSTSADREARAQQLANLFVGEMLALLVQVRQDFLDKPKHELVYNCQTFTEYCVRVLCRGGGYLTIAVDCITDGSAC
jgi:hypothetical protein